MGVERLTKLGRVSVRMFARGDERDEVVLGLIIQGYRDRQAAAAARALGWKVSPMLVWRIRHKYVKAMKRARELDGLRRDEFLPPVGETD